MLRMLSIFASLATLIPAMAQADQRAFPTGTPGALVTYLDPPRTGSPSTCLVAIAGGLPAFAWSIAFYSNGASEITVAAKRDLSAIDIGAAATLKVNQAYVFGHVDGRHGDEHFQSITIHPVDRAAAYNLISVVTDMSEHSSHIDVVADSSDLGSVALPAQVGLGQAFIDCQSYMLKN